MSDETTRDHILSFIGVSPDRAHQPAGSTESGSPPVPGPDPWTWLWSVLAAHLVELRHAGVIDEQAFAVVARSLVLARQAPGGEARSRSRAAELTGVVESRLPVEARGVATLGLAHEEWLATVTRLAWREASISLMDGVLGLSERVLTLAETHTVTIMAAHVEGRPAQPTTLAHFLGGLISPLSTARSRLVSGFDRLNRSPLGAGLMAGELLDANRDDLAQRLGFDAVAVNTLDALASVEDVVETIDGASAVLGATARFLDEILVWVRTDPSSFVMDDAWLRQPEPRLPTFSVPARLHELGQQIRAASERLDGLRRVLRSLPFGPLGSAHDLVLRPALALPRELGTVLNDAAEFFATGLIVNRAWLGNRAGRGYSTAGDLAAFLVVEEQVAPEDAQRIATLVLSRLQESNLEVSGITQDMIDSAALMTIGQEIKVEMERLGRFLAPRRFLERRQVMGSPAPDMTRDWLSTERQNLDRDRAWLDARRRQSQRSLVDLAHAIDEAAELPET